MKSKKLCAVIALAMLGTATSANAADYWDDRWYFAPWIGVSHNDSDRNVDDNSLLIGAGIGKYVAPNTTVDVFVDRTSRHRDEPFTSNWANTMFGVSVRYYFGDIEAWQPYIMAGVGMDNHRANYKPFGRAGEDYGWDPALQIGVGLAKSYSEDIRWRFELAYRHDMDDNSRDEFGDRGDDYGDVLFTIGMMWGLGEMAAAAPPPAPGAAPPTQQPPPAKQPPAPPAQDKVVIDLRGVNFRFDYPKKGETDVNKAGLVEGSIALLDQAVDVLKRYPNVRVEVAGHTDSVGTDEYNQGLSERRAQIVYDYLTSHGIDRSRLSGPKGFGEGSPIDTNQTKEGRARNRRTELVVQ